jgi:rfaE bifunctional protein nucleotidyltransferase chain/domain
MSDASQHSFLLPQDIRQKLEDARKKGERIVFVSGVFDLLHDEHIRFLQKAKAAGDFLFVALESDVRVRQMKGEGRPVDSQEVRRQKIQEIGVVDIIFILPDDFGDPKKHRQIIEEVRPAFLAVSSNSPYLEKKKEIVEEFGGELVVVHEHNPDVSTTQLLAQMKKR